MKGGPTTRGWLSHAPDGRETFLHRKTELMRRHHSNQALPPSNTMTTPRLAITIPLTGKPNRLNAPDRSPFNAVVHPRSVAGQPLG